MADFLATVLPQDLSRGSEKDMPTSHVKPFDISKLMVWEAYRKVAANKVLRKWTRCEREQAPGHCRGPVARIARLAGAFSSA
jgi:hypothetical protein